VTLARDQIDQDALAAESGMALEVDTARPTTAGLAARPKATSNMRRIQHRSVVRSGLL